MYGLIRKSETRRVLTLERTYCLRWAGCLLQYKFRFDARMRKLVPARGVTCSWLCNPKVEPYDQQSVTREKTLSSLQAESDSLSKAILLYKFPWIRHLRFISRLKQFQAGFVILLTFPISYWYQQGLINDFNLIAGVTAATATTIMLFIISYIFRRVVGELRYNPQSGIVHLSTLTFWSQRRNQAFHCSDIIPASESQWHAGKMWLRLEIFDHSDIYLYSLRLGTIYHQELLWQLLGIWQRDNKLS